MTAKAEGRWALSRIVTGGRRFIPVIDGLRFIAISGVVLFHQRNYTLARHMSGASVRIYDDWLSQLFSVGGYGVHLFYVLSGFLLALPFAKYRLGLAARPVLKTYFLRRLTRLEPLYIVLMTLTFLSGIFAFGRTEALSRWPHLLASLLYQHNIIYGASGVAWTLEIEVQFYCLAPVLTVLFSIPNTRLRRTVFLAVMVALPLLRTFIPAELMDRYSCLPWYLEYFIAGFLLVDVFLLDWKESPETSLR